jgi:hypothetical protein
MRALSAEASLLGAGASRQATAAAIARWRTWCADVTALLTRLHADEEARTHLERQYLDGGSSPPVCPEMARTPGWLC